MVFESLVADIMNKILGDYVVNLNTRQLKIGIWSGTVQLYNLKLRETALDDFDLPVRLVYGSIGAFELKIPWKNLYSEPVKVLIKDFYVLIAPRQSVKYDPVKEAEHEMQSKASALNAFEREYQKELEKDQPKPDAGYLEKLVTQVVNNLKFVIRNVHVRYEDTFSGKSPFACGISLDSLQLFTTDANWVKSYLTEQVQYVHKLVQMEYCAVYMNCTAILFTEQSQEEFTELFRNNIARFDFTPNYSYVLAPLSILAKMKLNSLPEYEDPPFQIAKLDVFLEMEKLYLQLTNTQFDNILLVTEDVNRLQTAVPYRKYRPFDIPYKGHYREWWKFVITVVLNEFVIKRNREKSWAHIKQHRDLCRLYAKNVKIKELSRKPSPAVLKELEACERKLDIFNLILIRKQVKIEVEKIHKQQEALSAFPKTSWYTSWFRWRSKNADSSNQPTTLTQKIEAVMTEDEKKRLYKALGYTDPDLPTMIPKEFISARIRLLLKLFELCLVNDAPGIHLDLRTSYRKEGNPKHETILSFKLDMVESRLEYRTAANALCIVSEIVSVKSMGIRKSHRHKRPIILESYIPKNTSLEGSEEHEQKPESKSIFLDFLFETNPLDESCDQRIRLNLRPLRVIYDADTITYLLQTFVPAKPKKSESEGTAYLRMATYKERSATGIAYLIDSRKAMQVEIDILPITVIIPNNGQYRENRNFMFVGTLGQIYVTSTPGKRETSDFIAELFNTGVEREAILAQVMEQTYDKFEIKLKNIQLLIVKPQEMWEEVMQTGALSELQVLRPMSITIEIYVCAIADDPRLPKMRVNIILPSVNVNVTEDRVYVALNILSSLPMPEPGLPSTASAISLKDHVSEGSAMSMRTVVTQFLPPPMGKHFNRGLTKAALLKLKNADTKEIIQYTSLELRFTVKLLRVVLSKSCLSADNCEDDLMQIIEDYQTGEALSSHGVALQPDVDEADKPYYEFGNGDTSGGLNAATNFAPFEADTDVSLEYLDSDSKLGALKSLQEVFTQPLIKFEMIRFEAEIAQRSYEVTLTAKLGELNMSQYDYFEKKVRELHVLHTPLLSEEIQYLLTVSFMQAAKFAPNFKTYYESTEQFVSIRFATLHVTLHQECLQRLLVIVNKMQRRRESIILTYAKNSMDATFTRRRLFESNLTETLKRRRTHHRKKKEFNENIKFRLKANLEHVGLKLTSRHRPICMMEIKQFATDLIYKTAYTSLQYQLKDVIIKDLNPETIHTNFLTLVGSDVFRCHVYLYNKKVIALPKNTPDIVLNLTIGQMKIVYLNWFARSILNFLNNFQAAKSAIVDAGAAAADATKQTAIEVIENATRLKLNVRIDAPILVLPVDSQSSAAVALDLGFIKIWNNIHEIYVLDEHSDSQKEDNKSFTAAEETYNERKRVTEKTEVATIDDMYLELKKLKMWKVNIVNNAFTSGGIEFMASYDSIDISYGLRQTINILDPISMKVHVKRNLASSWYKDVPKMSIVGGSKPLEFNLFKTDYALIMRIITQNFNEGDDEFAFIDDFVVMKMSASNLRHPLSKSHISKSKRTIDSREHGINAKITNGTDESHKKVDTDVPVFELLKLDLQLEGVMVNLLLDQRESLAHFGLYYLSLRFIRRDDDSQDVSLVLCNLQINDLRANRENIIKSYLYRKNWEKNLTSMPMSDDRRMALIKPKDIIDRCYAEKNFLFKYRSKVKDNEENTKVYLANFELIICIDFLLQISAFTTVATASRAGQTIFREHTPDQFRSKTIYSADTVDEEENQIDEVDNRKIEFKVFMEEPEIILVDDITDPDPRAIIFHMQIILSYIAIGSKKIVSGEINPLNMYMCSFIPEKRTFTRHYILNPCCITLDGDTPEEEGLHIKLIATDILINISPIVIELINKALNTMNQANAEIQAQHVERISYKDIWKQKAFRKRDHWFLQTDRKLHKGNSDSLVSWRRSVANIAVRTERCLVDIPFLAVILEAGIGYYSTPLFSLNSHFSATVENWSKNLSVNGSMGLKLDYYNQDFAAWEPVIEPIQNLTLVDEEPTRPWIINFELTTEMKLNEFDNRSHIRFTKLRIFSEENLEITVSKTFIDLVTTTADALTEALDLEGLIRPNIVTPCMLHNNTGTDLTLNFQKGTYILHSCHKRSSADEPNPFNVGLTLIGKLFQTDPLEVDQVESCKVSSGATVHLDVDYKRIDDNPPSIYIKVGLLEHEQELSVARTAKRYYRLPRTTQELSWGIVSDVAIEHGITILNIQGVLDLCNEFTVPVRVYCIKPNTAADNMIPLTEIDAGETYHVPLHAIYAENKSLYFSFSGYQISAQGFRWNYNSDVSPYNKLLQCNPAGPSDPLYINAVRVKAAVHYENTNLYDDQWSFYTVYLKPTFYFQNALPIPVSVNFSGCQIYEVNKEVKNDERFDTVLVYRSGSKSKSTKRSIFSKEALMSSGEIEVQPGDILQLPAMKTACKHKNRRNYLVFKIFNYLDRDWVFVFDSITTEEHLDEWTFMSYDSEAQMDLTLSALFEDDMKSTHIILFSPFWMINKTGLMLSYKKFDSSNIDVYYHPPEYKGAILYSMKKPSACDKKYTVIRVDDGKWSNKVPLHVAGTKGAITCSVGEKSYEIAVHNELTRNCFTKRVTFLPFFLALNKCEFIIRIRAVQSKDDPWMKLLSNSVLPLWPSNEDEKILVCRIHGQLTAAFSYAEPTCVLLKLKNNSYGGINVDVRMTEGGAYIIFTEYNPGDAPALLVNHTRLAISYYESCRGKKEYDTLRSGFKVLHTWCDPTSEKFLVFGKEEIANDLKRDGIGRVILFDGTWAYWVSFLDGLQRVLLFTENKTVATLSESSATLQNVTRSVELSINRVALSIVNNQISEDILYMSINNSGIIWESKKVGKKRFRAMKAKEIKQMEKCYQEFLKDASSDSAAKYYLKNKVEIDFNQMLLHRNPKCIIKREFFPGVWIQLNTSKYQTSTNLKIHKIQIDNQREDFIFPVILVATNPPRSVAETVSQKPIIEASIIKRVVPNSNVKQYKHASLLVHPFYLRVDLPFLSAIMKLFHNTITVEQAEKQFLEDCASIANPISAIIQAQCTQEQKNFYDYLHLGSMKIYVSFTMTGSDISLPTLISSIVQVIGVTLTDVNDVEFNLSEFQRTFEFFTNRQLTSEVTSHYTNKVLKQLYVLVFGLNVLGNPYGFAMGVSKGVKDLFYEPYLGGIQGAEEFSEGLAIGFKSFFTQTVGGTASVMSRIMGALGKSCATLTFDEEFRKNRRKESFRRPDTLRGTLAKNGRKLFCGILHGATGIVVKPINGAREGGAEGFFKGIGKGVIGVFTRPTVSVADFASSSFAAVKRAVGLRDYTTRRRPARFFNQDKILRAYSLPDAESSKILREILDGKFSTTDFFIHMEEVIESKERVIITNMRILYVRKNELIGTWTHKWSFIWSDILLVESTTNGVEIKVKLRVKKILRLIKRRTVNLHVIPIKNRHQRDALLEIIESQRLLRTSS